MTNADVVKYWIDYCKSSKKTLPEWHATANVHCSSKHLYSYATPIAEFKNGKFYLTSVKYSTTTSKHQNLVKYFTEPEELVIINNEIKEI